MTRAVYFDCDGTLLTFPDGYGAVFEAACDRVGLDDTETVGEAYNDAFFAAFGEFDPDPYYAGADAAVAAAGSELAPDTFAEAIRSVEVERSTVREEVRAALDALPAEDRVGVLTNGVTDHQRRKLAHHGLLDRFDAVVASYEVGAHKPDSAAFDAARAAIDADEYVYVGDSVDHDVVPAIDNGFRAIHPDGVPAADGGLDDL